MREPESLMKQMRDLGLIANENIPTTNISKLHPKIYGSFSGRKDFLPLSILFYKRVQGFESNQMSSRILWEEEHDTKLLACALACANAIHKDLTFLCVFLKT